MSDDIVTRLRERYCSHGNNYDGAWQPIEWPSTCERCELDKQAANEIERLRAMCDQFAESAKMFGTQWGSEVVDFRVNEKKLKRAWLKYKEMRNG